MKSEQMKVLEMLQEGTITAEEAATLLESMEEVPVQPERKAAQVPSSADKANMTGKKLRIEVNGSDYDEAYNVNVAIPLVLARFTDNIIENCVPEEVNDRLEDKGINLRRLNLRELIDTIETLDEDIVNIDYDAEDKPAKVRIYVE